MPDDDGSHDDFRYDVGDYYAGGGWGDDDIVMMIVIIVPGW